MVKVTNFFLVFLFVTIAAAKEADNVFYYLTYGDTLDISKLQGEGLNFEAIKLQVQYFGQTPVQLFGQPHPARDPLPTIPLQPVPTFDSEAFVVLPQLSCQ